VKLSFQIRGDQSHSAILFLHGFMGLGNDWLPIAETLSRDYCCILPDLPGHGQSQDISEDMPLDMQITSTAILALLDDLRIDRCTLIGYSMGGRIALYLAVHFPQRIKAMVLESANPGIEDDSERIARAAMDDQRSAQLESEGIAVFVERWYDSPLFTTLHREPEKLTRLKESRRVHDSHLLAIALRGLSIGRQRSLWADLHNIKVPFLLISGSLDSKYCDTSCKMAEVLPNCRHEVINDAGHNTHFERPEEFLAQISGFLHDSFD
jgi:2-succinyl-6-hydroxy-2,4-cyclohexadiene-1-carboxylate synthase